MPKRRTRGGGGLVQRHDHPTCPPVDADGTRPKHSCKGRWCGTVDAIVDGRKRRKYVYGRTQREARLKLDAAVRDRDQGTLIIGTTTVEQWMNQWLETRERVLKAQTTRSYRSKINTYIVPSLGRHRLTSLRPLHIDALYQGMRDRGLAEATVRQTHAILGKALNDAVRKGALSVNPVVRADKPGTETNDRAALTLTQAKAVLRAAGDDARWWLALFCGMRQGEVLGLRWNDVDLTNHVLTITQTLQTAEDGSLFFGRPKSKAGSRSWPMPPHIEARLRLRWLHEGQPLGGLVFPRRDGEPVRPRDDWQAWRDLLDLATVPPLAPMPVVALHAARNSAASLMEAAGVSDRLAMQILGHSSVQMTHSYQSADPERVLAAWTAMGALLELD